MNILITGGSGLIGGRLIHRLLENKKNIVTATYFKNKINLKSTRLKKIKHSEKLSDIKKIIKDQDVVIHTIATDKKLSKINPKLAFKTNLDYTKKIYIESLNQKVKKFIYFSTSQVYGDKLEGIIKENKKPYCKKNVYAYSHLLAEKNILFYKKKLNKKITTIIIRLSNSFGKPANTGPRIWNPIINEFCYQALNNKKIIIDNPHLFRSFVSLITVEKLIILFLRKIYSKDILCNLGGETYSLINIARFIQDKIFSVLGFKVHLILKDKKMQKIKHFKYISKYKFVNSIFTKKDFEKEIISLLKFIKKKYS